MTHVHVPGVGTFARHSVPSPWGGDDHVTYTTIDLEPSRKSRLVRWIVGLGAGVLSFLWVLRTP